jgi:hypothetical protein
MLANLNYSVRNQDRDCFWGIVIKQGMEAFGVLVNVLSLNVVDG